MDEAELKKRLQNRDTRNIFSFLLHRKEPSDTVDLAKALRKDVAEILLVLQVFIQQGLITVLNGGAALNESGHKVLLTSDQKSLAFICKYLHEAELQEIADRSQCFDLQAAQKIEALEELTDAVMVAREHVRKNEIIS